MKPSFIGTYLKMLQVGNGLSDHDLATFCQIDEKRLRLILKHPFSMTTHELVRLALAFEVDIEVNLGKRVLSTTQKSAAPG